MQRVLCVVNMVCECLREWIKSMKGKKLEIKKRKINIVCKWKFSLFTFYLAKQKHTSIGLKRRQKSHFEVESQMPSSAEEQQNNNRKYVCNFQIISLVTFQTQINFWHLFYCFFNLVLERTIVFDWIFMCSKFDPLMKIQIGARLVRDKRIE